VVPVLDLATRFGRKPSEATRRTCIVIVEVESHDDKQDIGVIVDAVNEVLEIPGSEIEPPPSFGTRLRPDLIRGMGKVGGRFVIILDTNRVLASEEIGAVSRGASAEPADEPLEAAA
jgi:purine-binding chemotaxis protein CheW